MKSDIISLGKYEQHRQLCHGVKNGNISAIIDAAALLASITPEDSTIIPIPSHYGRPTYTMDIAMHIAKIKNCVVDTCIVGNERKRLYDLKKDNLPIDLNFYITHRPKGNLFLLDNCVDTGTTYRAAKRLLDIPIITIATTFLFNDNKLLNT